MQIKKLKLLFSTFVIISSVVTLTGCLERVELKKLGIVAGMGIDKIDDQYKVTLQILNPSAIAGESTNTLPVYTLTAEGESIHEAYRKLDQLTSTTLFFSHLSAIVIDEDFAKAGFSPLLNFALRHAEIRPDMTILVAKGESARNVLNVVTALDLIPAAQLDVSTMIPVHTGRLTNSNLYEVVNMVNMKTNNVVLNAVTIHREEDHINENLQRKDGTEGKAKRNGSTIDNILDISLPVQLRIEHQAIFQSDELVGYIDDNEAELYNIILGEHKQYSIEVRIDEEYYTSAEITQVTSEIKTDLLNKEATIHLNLDAIIIENTYPIDFTKTENLVTMSDYVQNQLEKEMIDFIDKIQTEMKSDIFGIAGKAETQENKTWKEIEGYWSEIFPDMTINVEIELNIDSVGEIGNIKL